VSRLFAPVAIDFAEAILIACLGLAVNVASVWLLGGAHHGHAHGPGHAHAHGDAHSHDGRDQHEAEHRLTLGDASLGLRIYERDHPPVFRLRAERGPSPAAEAVTVETARPDGTHQVFAFEDRGGVLQSVEEIPEPHAFTARVLVGGVAATVAFEEHEHPAVGAVHRDNNMRAAVVHVMADAAVSVLVIVGLVLARAFGWLWMDPVAGLVGAVVIASWSYGLVRDTGAILLDMAPDGAVGAEIRQSVEREGDRLQDLHVWRLGPGHLGAIISVATDQAHDAGFYRERLARLPSLSHLTVEVVRTRSALPA
jgi:cation diffusion facilitator family transporter